MNTRTRTMRGDARLSADGLYRYWLVRRDVVPRGRGTVLFVMLNPSKADASADDATVRRCVGFAERWKFETVEVVNLFAFRATDPAALSTQPMDVAIGEDNNGWIYERASLADQTVAAWGKHGRLHGRDGVVSGMLRSLEAKPLCLDVLKGGEPRHPLMAPYDVKLKPWNWRLT